MGGQSISSGQTATGVVTVVTTVVVTGSVLVREGSNIIHKAKHRMTVGRNPQNMIAKVLILVAEELLKLIENLPLILGVDESGIGHLLHGVDVVFLVGSSG